MSDYLIKDGQISLSPEFLKRRIRLKYSTLFPVSPNPVLSEKYLKLVKQNLLSVDFTKGTIIFSDADMRNAVFLYGIVSVKEDYSMLVMNAYHLLEIMLGLVKEDEDYSAISQLDHHILALYLGYSEMENKRQSDVIEQLMGLSSTRGPLRKQLESGVPVKKGQVVWIFYKGSRRHFEQKYPGVYNLAKSLNYNLVDIGNKSVADDSVEEL